MNRSKSLLALSNEFSLGLNKKPTKFVGEYPLEICEKCSSSVSVLDEVISLSSRKTELEEELSEYSKMLKEERKELSKIKKTQKAKAKIISISPIKEETSKTKTSKRKKKPIKSNRDSKSFATAEIDSMSIQSDVAEKAITIIKIEETSKDWEKESQAIGDTAIAQNSLKKFKKLLNYPPKNNTPGPGQYSPSQQFSSVKYSIPKDKRTLKLSKEMSMLSSQNYFAKDYYSPGPGMYSPWGRSSSASYTFPKDPRRAFHYS